MAGFAFFAYPGGFHIINDAVQGVVDHSSTSTLTIRPWEKMQIVGLKLDDLIRDQIKNADFLIADVTYPNFNVFYEMGFAAASGKPVIPAVNSAVGNSVKRLTELGLFDTIGWATYTNADKLFHKLTGWRDCT